MAAILPSTYVMPHLTSSTRQAKPTQAIPAVGLLSRAWDLWLGLIFGRFLVFTGVLCYLLSTSRISDAPLGRQWFVGMMLFLAITTPFAFLTRYLLDRNAKEHGKIGSLRGTAFLWFYFELTWLLCMAGSVHAVELTPLLPAVITLVLLLTVFPAASVTPASAVQAASAPANVKWCKKDRCLCNSQGPCASQTALITLTTPRKTVTQVH